MYTWCRQNMSKINRSILILLLVLSVFTAGCLANDSVNKDTETPSLEDPQPNNSMSNKSGPIQAKVVESPPSSATVVPSNDERIADVDPIQKGVSQAVEKEGTPRKVGLKLEGMQYTKTSQALKKLPRYNDSPAADGYYIRHKGKVVRVILLVEE